MMYIQIDGGGNKGKTGRVDHMGHKVVCICLSDYPIFSLDFFINPIMDGLAFL